MMQVRSENDSQHAKAKKLLAGISDVEILVPEYILIEVATVLKKMGHAEVSKKFVSEVMQSSGPILLAGETLAVATSEHFLKRTKDDLSFVDTALLVLADQYTVVTFDKALANAISNR